LLEMKELKQVSQKIIPSNAWRTNVWVDLCWKLNSYLSPQVYLLKTQLSSVIDPQRWKDWKGSTRIFDCIEYLKRSKGNAGLKLFRDTLEALGETISVGEIDSSECAYLFQ